MEIIQSELNSVWMILFGPDSIRNRTEIGGGEARYQFNLQERYITIAWDHLAYPSGIGQLCRVSRSQIRKREHGMARVCAGSCVERIERICPENKTMARIGSLEEDKYREAAEKGWGIGLYFWHRY